MPLPIDIPSIIKLAEVSHFMVLKLEAQQAVLKGGTINYKYRARNLWAAKDAVEWRYSQVPDASDLILTGNFLYQLCLVGPAQQYIINAAGALPVVSGPSNQSVNAGATATFTVVASGVGPFTYQWKKNGSPLSDGGDISGATTASLQIANVENADQAGYSATVSNATGSVTSGTGTLTVVTALTGQAYYGDTDFFAELEAGIDNVPYNISFNITDGQPLVVNYTSSGANNKWRVVKYPDTQSVKVSYADDDGGGPIPDGVYRPIISIGSNRYIISRVDNSIDVTNPVVTYS